MEYDELDKHFIAPETISPFYGDIRIPRKLKKKVRKWCGEPFKRLTNAEALWYYMEKSNPNYKRFLIKQICQQ